MVAFFPRVTYVLIQHLTTNAFSARDDLFQFPVNLIQECHTCIMYEAKILEFSWSRLLYTGMAKKYGTNWSVKIAEKFASDWVKEI